MIVKCLKHPELYIYDLGVKFSKGIAEVKDKKKLEALKAMKNYLFEFEGEKTEE